MKRIFFLCLIHFVFIPQIISGKKNFIPKYNSIGPQNIYYLTGVGNKLFGGDEIWSNQDGWSKPYIALRDAYIELGYNFYTSLPQKIDSEFKKNVYAIFCHNIGSQAWCLWLGNLVDKVIIIVTEPPHTMPQNYNPLLTKYFKKILTWDDTKIDNKKYFKYFFVQANLKMIDKPVAFESKKLCTFIGGNKNFSHQYELYSQRIAAIRFFEAHAPKDFDFYGHGWDKKNYSTYRGPVKSKTDTLKKYKFSICYENIANQKGYITEKIFGSFVAGCLPIYWGADNVTDYIPSDCFIDKRKFPNFNDLYTFISTMKEEEYNKYLENIKRFLASKEVEKYSIDYFVKNLMSIYD